MKIASAIGAAHDWHNRVDRIDRILAHAVKASELIAACPAYATCGITGARATPSG